MSSSRDRAFGQRVEPTEVRVERERPKVSKATTILIQITFVVVVLALIAPAIVWFWRLALGLA